jgi:hypothetical protein
MANLPILIIKSNFPFPPFAKPNNILLWIDIVKNFKEVLMSRLEKGRDLHAEKISSLVKLASLHKRLAYYEQRQGKEKVFVGDFMKIIRLERLVGDVREQIATIEMEIRQEKFHSSFRKKIDELTFALFMVVQLCFIFERRQRPNVTYHSDLDSFPDCSLCPLRYAAG